MSKRKDIKAPGISLFQNPIVFLAIGLIFGNMMTFIALKAFDRQDSPKQAQHVLERSEDAANVSTVTENFEDLSGDEFDREFLEHMIPHHQEAIVVSRIALRNSDREEVKNLAQQIIESQQKEIDMMRQWASQWNVTPPATHH